MKRPLFQNALKLLFLLVITNVIGMLGAFFITPDALNWYRTLPLAPLTPPDSVFAVAWSIAYVLLALAGFASWGKTSPRPFVLYLAFALVWPIFFFKMRNIGLAFLDVLAMDVFAFLTLKAYLKASKAAFIFMLLPTLWTLFATYLNGWVFLSRFF